MTPQDIEALIAQPKKREENGGKTGRPPGLLQDDSRQLTKWFAGRIDARWTVRRVCAEIEAKRHD